MRFVGAVGRWELYYVAMSVAVKRAYEAAAAGDGYRVLVDRLWPRGVNKDTLKLDEWMKDVAPSTGLRKWYGHEPEKWKEFQRRYRGELAEPSVKELVQKLAARARRGKVTLLTGARDAEHSDAAVLAAML